MIRTLPDDFGSNYQCSVLNLQKDLYTSCTLECKAEGNLVSH